MSFKQQSVSMPTGSAGIIGFSSDLKISGKEIDPKYLIVFAVIVVMIVKVISTLVSV